MKNLLLPIGIIIVLAGCNTDQKVSIRGTVSNGEGALLVLQRLDVNSIIDVDSTRVDNKEQFSFKLSLDHPELLILKNENGELINLLPAPGEQVTVNSAYEEFGSAYSIGNSEESEKIRDLVLTLNSTRHKMDSIAEAISAFEDPESPQMKLLQSAYQQAYVQQKRFTIRFIIENPSSLSSVYALYQKLYDELYIMNDPNDLQYFKFVADTLKLYHPDASLTKSLIADIESRERQYQENNTLQSMIASAEEKSLLDIAVPDINGDTISLSSLYGKVVMVVFWASEDRESIKTLLDLQKTYKKYHSKGFEVYAVSLDNIKTPWEISVKFNEFDWLNVSELSYPNSKVDKLYNVTKLPTNYLINREGTLMAKDLYGRNLEIWLDNLL